VLVAVGINCAQRDPRCAGSEVPLGVEPKTVDLVELGAIDRDIAAGA
jgi:hypothetical protein